MGTTMITREIGGEIAYYGLVDWWLTSFTVGEREQVEARYMPIAVSIGGHEGGFMIRGSLTTGEITFAKQRSAAQFLFTLSDSFFQSPEERYLGLVIRAKAMTLTADNPIIGPGYVDGRHFSTFVEEVKQLKREKKYEEALVLLHRLQIASAGIGQKAGTALPTPTWYTEQTHIVEQAIAKASKAKGKSMGESMP
jgi:hypothetical protein